MKLKKGDNFIWAQFGLVLANFKVNFWAIHCWFETICTIWHAYNIYITLNQKVQWDKIYRVTYNPSDFYMDILLIYNIKSCFTCFAHVVYTGFVLQLIILDLVDEFSDTDWSGGRIKTIKNKNNVFFSYLRTTVHVYV